MHAFRHHRCSLEQYYEIELQNETKFEYFQGAILAMAGGTVNHNIVAVNAVSALHTRYSPRCRVFASDQRVATADGLHTYPDGAVVCGEAQLSSYKGTETVHNPVVILEVLSKSTREYDLGEKLEHYQTIPSLRDILLVEPDVVDVRHVRRTAEGWETLRFRSIADVVRLSVNEVELPLAAIYAGAAIKPEEDR